MPSASSSESTVTTRFSSRDHDSSVQFVEPGPDRAGVADDEAAMHQVGDAGDRARGESQALPRRRAGPRRRRHRDRVPVVEVVGEADGDSPRGAAPSSAPITISSGPGRQVEVVESELEAPLGRVDEGGRPPARRSTGRWPPSESVRAEIMCASWTSPRFFDTGRRSTTTSRDPVDRKVLERIVARGRRAPSGGFSQGLRLVVVTDAQTRAARSPRSRRRTSTSRRGIEAVDLPRPGPHRRRRCARRTTRALPPAGQADRRGAGEIDWPVPYWFVDAGAAMMLLMLAAVDEGLGSGVFGLAQRLGGAPLWELLGIADDVASGRGRHRRQARGASRPAARARSGAGSRSTTWSAGSGGRKLPRLVQRLAGARIGATLSTSTLFSSFVASGLTAYLEARADAPFLLVGEAAGYRGARVSGNPVHLRAAAERGPGRPRRQRRSCTA